MASTQDLAELGDLGDFGNCDDVDDLAGDLDLFQYLPPVVPCALCLCRSFPGTGDFDLALSLELLVLAGTGDFDRFFLDPAAPGADLVPVADASRLRDFAAIPLEISELPEPALPAPPLMLSELPTDRTEPFLLMGVL